FVDEIGAEHGAIQFTTPFAEQALNIPFFPQPTKCRHKIELCLSKHCHFRRNLPEPFDTTFWNRPGSEDNNRREAVTKDLCLGVDSAGTADNHSKIILRPPSPKPSASILS